MCRAREGEAPAEPGRRDNVGLPFSSEERNEDRDHNPVNEITDITNTTGPAWTTPTYDPLGNMTLGPSPLDPDDPNKNQTYLWDAWNRLVEVKQGETKLAGFVYDGLHRRIIKLLADKAHHYYFSDAHQLLEESGQWQILEERLAGSTDPERHFVWGLRYVDDIVARDRDTDDDGVLDERLYGIQDGNWNATTLASDAGTIVERYVYSPYGVPLFLDVDFEPEATSTVNWASLYTGREFDFATGIFYFRARFYHCQLGRFLSRDPLSEADPGWYVYAANNPIGWVDPSGLIEITPVRQRLDIGCAHHPASRAHVIWRWTLSGAWPCRTTYGYFIQKVEFFCDVDECTGDCPTFIPDREKHGDPMVLYEAARVTRSRASADDLGTGNCVEGYCGYTVNVGTVRFVCGDRVGRIERPRTGWVERRQGVTFGEPPCTITVGPIVYLHHNRTPHEWNQHVRSEPERRRHIRAIFECCDCAKECQIRAHPKLEKDNE